MPHIPQRISLLAQTVESLRSGIASGLWVDVLAPERELCSQLEISRSTLRRAIEKIESEGLIDAGGAGKRRRIVRRPDFPTLASTSGKVQTITWVTRLTLAEMPSVNLRLIAQLQSRLSSHSCTLTVVRLPEKVITHPDQYMKEWLQEHAADVWILHWMPESVQRWFFKHEPVACIFGSAASGVELASIEVDSLAPMRHAVAMLQRKGHRRISLVRQAQSLVGEQRLEDALHELSAEDLQASVIACPTEPELMAREFERVFTSKEVALPTALVCTNSQLALFALTWLQRNRVAIPEQVSIVLLRSQRLMEYVNPSLAHYALNEERAIIHLLPRLLDLLQTRTCSTAHIELVPEFVEGGSLDTVGDPRDYSSVGKPPALLG